MFVTLSNFKIYKEKEFYFPKSSISLIYGESGKGKSTICQAIHWCLYGGMQHISNNNTTEDKVSVTLKLFEKDNNWDLTIKRSKPPRLLSVKYKDEIYNDSSAEEFIASMFGSKDLWTCSSYMIQKKQSPLLVLSNIQKFELLHELTFGEVHDITENPDHYIEKIDNKLEEIGPNILKLTSECNAEEELIKRLSKEYENSLQLWNEFDKTDEQLQEIITAYNKKKEKMENIKKNIDYKKFLENNISELKQKVEEIKGNELYQISVDEISAQISLGKEIAIREELKNKLNNLYYNEEHDMLLDSEKDNYLSNLIYTKQIYELLKKNKIQDIDSYAEKFSLFHKFLTYQETKKNYEKYIISMQLLEKYENTKKKEIWERNAILVDEYNNYLENTEILKQLYIIRDNYLNNIEYEHYNSLLSIKKYYENENVKKIYELENKNYELYLKNLKEYEKYVSLSNSLKNIIEVDVENKIKNYELCKDEILCPCCGKGLRYKDGKLIKGSDYIYNKEDHKKLIDIYETVKNKNNCKVKELPVEVKKPEKTWNEKISKMKVNMGIEKVTEELKKCKPVEYINMTEELTYDEVIKHISQLEKCKKVEKVEKLEKNFNVGMEDVFLTKDEYEKHKKTQIVEWEKDDMLENCKDLKNVEKIDIERIVRFDKEKINSEITSLKNKETVFSLKNELEKCTKSEECINVSNMKNKLNSRIKMDNLLINYNEEIMKKEKEKIFEICEDKYISLCEDVKELKEIMDGGKNVIYYEQKKIDLRNKKSVLLKNIAQESNLVELKKLISEISTSAMDSVLGNVNYIANMFLQELFEDDIYVKLDTHKELKQKKENKLQVNLKIDYRNISYDNIEQLSGGENTRISFALTLALAKTLSSPFLMLDECMSSLDGDLREKCLKLLKRNFGDIIVLHICHETVNGMHDNVLEL